MISRPYSTEFYTTSTPNSVSSYCNNTLVLRVRDSYYKYQSIKRTEAVPPTKKNTSFLYLGFSTIDLYLIFLIYKN
ncbi:hypothetical protein H8356DRAFT_1439131 [Neocallimastix lanati (nom. inval.)]|nr:hypothetical protein H8356DRAFT_1439131 [Neocallimastix sp. JGI-2020a]